MLDEDGGVSVVGWRRWWTRMTAVVVAVVTIGVHSQLSFLCCTTLTLCVGVPYSLVPTRPPFSDVYLDNRCLPKSQMFKTLLRNNTKNLRCSPRFQMFTEISDVNRWCSLHLIFFLLFLRTILNIWTHDGYRLRGNENMRNDTFSHITFSRVQHVLSHIIMQVISLYLE